jgi:hypothetical protein
LAIFFPSSSLRFIVFFFEGSSTMLYYCKRIAAGILSWYEYHTHIKILRQLITSKYCCTEK